MTMCNLNRVQFNPSSVHDSRAAWQHCTQVRIVAEDVIFAKAEMFRRSKKRLSPESLGGQSFGIAPRPTPVSNTLKWAASWPHFNLDQPP